MVNIGNTSTNYQPVQDQQQKGDQFYSGAYEYHQNGGILSLLLTRIVNYGSVLFLVVFSTWLVVCVDHSLLSQKRLLSDALVDRCFMRISFFNWLCILLLVGYCVVYDCYKLITRDYPQYLTMQRYFNTRLQIQDSQLSKVEWHVVVQKIVELEESEDAHSITNRLLRRDNYMIALFNKQLVPVNKHTKVLEWLLNYCILDYVFSDGLVREEILHDHNRTYLVKGLERRFLRSGIISLLLAPFVLLYLAVYFVFRYGSEMQRYPITIMARSWTLMARYQFRDYNELPHQLEKRLKQADPQAQEYVQLFPHSLHITLIASFVALVAGAFVLALSVLSVLDDDFLLQFHITPGRSVLWYLGLFGVIYSVSRGLMLSSGSQVLLSKKDQLKVITKITHYHPPHWNIQEDDVTYSEFASCYYQYRLLILLQEMLAVVVAPYYLIVILPQASAKIIDFVREHTVHVHNVGLVCSCAVFEFEQAKDTKMEMSMMNFKENFPEWSQSAAVSVPAAVPVRLQPQVRGGLSQQLYKPPPSDII